MRIASPKMHGQGDARHGRDSEAAGNSPAWRVSTVSSRLISAEPSDQAMISAPVSQETADAPDARRARHILSTDVIE